MDDKRELNDILIGGEDVKSKNTKKLILLIIAIVVLIIAIAAIMLNLSSNDTESIAADTTNVAQEANLPPSDGFGATTGATQADDDSIQFEQIVQEIKSRQQNAQGQNAQNVGQPSTPPPATPALNDTPKIQMPERVATPPQITSQKVVDSKPEASSMSKSNNGDIAENGIYLQVGAFSNTPNKQFLNSINKYSYRVQEIIINSKVITRYLIGPYASRNAAQKDVNAISRDITKPVLLEIR